MGALQKMDAAQRQRLFDCMKDNWWRLNSLYFIEDEDGNKVRFRLRPWQELLLRTMWYLNIILKARQMGFTTAIDIFILDRTLFNKNTKSGIIAHTREDAVIIFRTKIKFAYDSLPKEVRAVIRAKQDRAGEMVFSNGSSIRVAVSMRSGTLQYLHISEFGKLCAQSPLRAQEVISGSLNTIHKGCFAFIESTAEGAGGHFHRMTMKAKGHHDKGKELTRLEYKFHFFPWFDDPKYRVAVPDDFVLTTRWEKYFSGVEAAIGRCLDLEQKAWYVIKEDEQGDKMKQEFPSTPLEAFLFSGRPCFDPDALNTIEGVCEEPQRIVDVRLSDGEWEDRDDGLLQIWQEPQEEGEYAIGADVAEGLEHGDASSFDVLNERGQQVAHFNGRLDTDLFGQVLNWVAIKYNNAFLGVERNNHGHAVLNELKRLEYTNLYVEERLDRDSEEETEKVGWYTSQVFKPFIIDNLKALIRDCLAGIICKQTVDEARTYVIDAKGRTNAQDGCFDDRVMSYAIAHEMLRRMPRTPKRNQEPRRSGRNRDWRTR
jgi:hypothetical protein